MNTNATPATKPADHMSNAKVGSVVRYSDMGNPGAIYVVIEVTDCPWSTYRLRSVEEPYELNTTDGRQRGWKVVAA